MTKDSALGTPEVTLHCAECLPSRTTSWERPERKSAIHDRVLLLTPEWWSFRRRRRWGTLSKAFEKSRGTASICWSLSMSAARYCTVRLSWLSVERFFRNPCCKSEKRLWCSRWVMMVEWRVCSRVLHKLVRWAGNLLVNLYPLFWKLELLWLVSSQMEFVLDLMMLGIFYSFQVLS